MRAAQQIYDDTARGLLRAWGKCKDSTSGSRIAWLSIELANIYADADMKFDRQRWFDILNEKEIK